MEQYLAVHRLWDIVSGTETEPQGITEKATFIQNQKAAHTHIALHVSSSQLNSVRLECDPKKIWDELQCLNRPGGFGTHMALHCELYKMQKDPKISMSKWITSVHDVTQQITDLKGNIHDEEVIVILTNSLPESYRPLVVHLDSMEEKDQTISNVITCLIGEECHQEGEKDQEKD